MQRLENQGMEPQPTVSLAATSVTEAIGILAKGFPVHADVPFDGIFAGDHSVARRGRGYEFDGTKPYEPGDDLRDIDWHTSQRLGGQIPVVRQRHLDAVPNVSLVTDIARTRYKSNPGYFSEQDLAASALLGIARLANRSNLSTNLIVGGDKRILQTSRPIGGRQTLSIFHQLMKSATEGEGDLGRVNRLANVLQYAASRCMNGVVVVVADFRDDSLQEKPGEWIMQLRKLAASNQIIAVETINPWDTQLSDTISTLKAGEKIVRIPHGKKGEAVRRQYAQAAAVQQSHIDDALAQFASTHIKLHTAQPDWNSRLRQQLAYANRRSQKA